MILKTRSIFFEKLQVSDFLASTTHWLSLCFSMIESNVSGFYSVFVPMDLSEVLKINKLVSPDYALGENVPGSV